MAGIYIHVPFCKSKCNYCTFCRTTDGSSAEAYLEALTREFVLCQCCEQIETVYIGGGTPSSIGVTLLRRLLSAVREHFDLSYVVEYTVECNPEDMTYELAKMLVDMGVNRVSMGVQSLDDNMLKMMNRRHNVARVIQAVETLRNNGITNISIDFIYGLPQHKGYDYANDIEKFIAMNVPHLSAYALSYEEGSHFYNMLQKGLLSPTADDDVSEQYSLLTHKLNEAGYEHYEISNYARKGFHSRHNTSYWHRIPYYGFGPAACSLSGNSRRSNTYDIAHYIRALRDNLEYFDTETLSADDIYNEQVMLNLRTSAGLDIADIAAMGDKYKRHFLENVSPFIGDGSVVVRNNLYMINEDKWFISDYITSRLFV